MQGRELVRRFTADLEPTTDLEKAAKKAQIKEDEDIEVCEQVRVQKIYDGLDSDNASDFSAAEAARKALEQTCKQFAEETKASKTGRWGNLKSSSSQIKANEMFQGNSVNNFGELRNLVDNLDEKWREKNGPVFLNYQRLCKTLDNHKSVFKLFPSQNNYASVLCGSVSLIVQASVNHEAVPEFLSKSVADISEKAAQCAKLVDIVREKGLQERLADVYARLFRFYRDAMAWYLKSRASRLMSSFNEKLKDAFSEAVEEIKDKIDDMYREGDNILHLKVNMLDMMLRSQEDKAEKLYSSRQNSHDLYVSEIKAGTESINLLRETFRNFAALVVEQSEKVHRMEHEMIALTGAQKQLAVETIALENWDTISGMQLRAHCQRLTRFIVGDEGLKSFEQKVFWLADAMTLAKLDGWMSGEPISRTLWISSPRESMSSDKVSASRAAALSAIASAWESETPIISHFCRRPHAKNITDMMTVQEAGCIGAVLSLIHQLQQFIRDEEVVEISEDSIQSLDGSKDSWAVGLSILDTLLQRTPQLSYCVIDGLNELESSKGAEWCWELLGVLRAHQKRQTFNLLLTTTGQSRFLAEAINGKERYMALGIPRKVRIRKRLGKSSENEIDME